MARVENPSPTTSSERDTKPGNTGESKTDESTSSQTVTGVTPGQQGNIIPDLKHAINVAVEYLKKDFSADGEFVNYHPLEGQFPADGVKYDVPNWNTITPLTENTTLDVATYKLVIDVLLDISIELCNFYNFDPLLDDSSFLSYTNLIVERAELYLVTLPNESNKTLKLKEFILKILNTLYRDLNFGNVKYNATGFPNTVVFYPQRGDVTAHLTIGARGDWPLMFWSAIINIIEIYNSIRAFASRYDYYNFLNSSIKYEPDPIKTDDILHGSMFTSVDWGTVVEDWGSLHWPSTRKKPDGSTAFAGSFTYNDIESTNRWNFLTSSGLKTREASVHFKLTESLKAILKTLWAHYSAIIPAPENGQKDVKYISSFVQKYFPGIYHIDGIPRVLTRGTTKCSGPKSLHQWLIAIDFDPSRNCADWSCAYSRLSQPIYKAFLDIMEHYRWLSLGRHENWDWMHFQYALWDGPDKNQKNGL